MNDYMANKFAAEEEARRKEREEWEKKERALAEQKKAETKAKMMKLAKILAIVGGVIVVAVIVLVLVINLILPMSNYNKGMEYYNNGQYGLAAESLMKANGYKDSNEILEKISGYVVGNTITKGKYDQDGKADNGAEDIEWIVLKVEGDQALVISKNILDYGRYNSDTSNPPMTWAECSSRTWLNGDFYNSIFTDEEKAAVIKTKVTTADNSEFGTDGGEDTEDYLFLLSLEEAAELFADNDARKAYATKTAIANGAYKNPQSGGSSWWLRSSGEVQPQVAYVVDIGGVRNYGQPALQECGIRPAMWVTLEH